jgi:putative membrane protein
VRGWHIALLVLAASAYRFLPIAINTVAWRRLIPPPHRPPLRILLVLRWIGEAVNALVPWGQSGGDVVRAGLLSRRGVPAPEAAAVMLADLALGTLTQLLFTGLALVAGLATGRSTSTRPLVALVATTAAVLVLLGLVGPVLARTLASEAGARRWPRLARRAAGFRAAFRTLAVDRRGLAASSGWHLCAWLTQAGETWFVLTACGRPVSLWGALWLESLTAATRTAAFFLPAGVGAQEVALMTVGRGMGLDAPVLVTLALVKRMRELVTGAPAIAAWLLVRRRPAGERRA